MSLGGLTVGDAKAEPCPPRQAPPRQAPLQQAPPAAPQVPMASSGEALGRTALTLQALPGPQAAARSGRSLLHRSPSRSSQTRLNIAVLLSPQWQRNMAVLILQTE